MSFFRFPLALPMYITPLVYHPKIVSGHLECAPSQSCRGVKLFGIFSMHLIFSSMGGFVLFFHALSALLMYIVCLVYYSRIVFIHLEYVPSLVFLGGLSLHLNHLIP